MLSIGWRILKRDRARMAMVVFGVVFSVVLVTVEVGMLLGLMRNASLLIDRSRADLWVSKVDVKTFDFATPFDRRNKYLIEQVPGVADVEEFNVSYTMWRLPSGGNMSVQVVGIDTRGQQFPPLDLAEGRLEDVHNRDAIIIDESERAKLGGVELGDTVEIMGRRAKVVGFTQGMRTFTTTPLIFTSLDRSHDYGWVTEGGKTAIYFLVKTEEGADAEAVRAAIAARIPGVEVHTTSGFSWRTRIYWLVETGVGIGFIVAALLGLLVGGVIVSQTLYAMTLERIGEFGVLKALGAGMGDLSRIVLEQGAICGVVGLSVGLSISFALSVAASAAGTLVEMTWPLVAFVIALTMGTCFGSVLMPISRLRRVEPAMVFRV